MTTTQTGMNNRQDIIHAPKQENPWTNWNVSSVERIISMLAGGALAAYGVARRDWQGTGIALLGGYVAWRGISGHSFFYQTMAMNTAGYTGTIGRTPGGKGIRVCRAMTVNRSPEELYAFWHDVEKAPLYMNNIESVTSTGPRTSHWVAKGPGGKTVEWNSELLEDVPNALIAWHVHGKPTSANAGKVVFLPAPGGRGSVVTLEMDYFQFGNPLALQFSNVIGRIPEHEALETLRHFKELMEAGEIPTVQGQPKGQ